MAKPIAELFRSEANRTETSAYPSWWMYTAGMLEKDLGKEQEANARFRNALLLPDRMLAYHLTRLAQSEVRSSHTHLRLAGSPGDATFQAV